MSEKLDRPICGWRNGENCKRPATWAVIFVDDYRAHFSCEGHADQWNKHGRGCYLCEIKGYLPQTSIEENQRVAEEKRDRILAEFERRQQERRSSGTPKSHDL